MLKWQEPREVYLYRGVLDMRVGFDRLAEKIKAETDRAVISGGWYIFFSRRRDRVKIFYWDEDGYAIWMKRLEAGSYKTEKTNDGYEEITALDLKYLLEGVELSRVKMKKVVALGTYS